MQQLVFPMAPVMRAIPAVVAERRQTRASLQLNLPKPNPKIRSRAQEEFHEAFI